MLLWIYAERGENTPGRQKRIKRETWVFGMTKMVSFNQLSTSACKQTKIFKSVSKRKHHNETQRGLE